MIHSDWHRQIKDYQPAQKWYRHIAKRAAVAIIIKEGVDSELSLLMIQRAEYAHDRWSGQMAFPGGKQDPQDTNILATAKRELKEELALDNHLSLLGRLSDINARSSKPMEKAMVITPFVFMATHELAPVNNVEVAKTLWIPVAHFAESNRKTLAFRGKELPCFYYNDHCIWGLSLMMIDEMTSQLIHKNNNYYHS